MAKSVIEGMVIVCGILLSFFIGELNTEKNNIEIKKELIFDLSQSLNDDLKQISIIQNILIGSLNQISKLQDDIESNHQNLSDQEAINLILDIEVAASFFPSMGVYNELISTGSYELVNNSALKRTLIDLYETQKERNYTMSIGLDNLMLQYIRETLEGFSIRFSYNIAEGELYGDRVIENYKFDQNYYLSKNFYGLLSTLSFPANNYNNLLIAAKESIEDAKKLIIIEVADT
ncbi:MAG: DUF6090 family protein [Emcibacteraceae bacterium]|jgi:hypothetical protein|nr:DUF6090 family protein [Emcibacteraceae bacterium]|tara:strand:+ start:136 stop:834 length:699 start_codon:yes stop_codon:yes gene_type:complete